MTKDIYMRIMHNKGRCVLFLDDNNKAKAVATFVFTDEPEKMENGESWCVPNEDKDGKYVLIHRLVTDKDCPIKENVKIVMEYFNKMYPDKKMLWISRRATNEHKKVFAESAV